MCSVSRTRRSTHSDHGTQYTSVALDNRCEAVGIRPSMGSVGDCYGNAMAELFFASLEGELLAKRRGSRNQIEAKFAVFEYIKGRFVSIPP